MARTVALEQRFWSKVNRLGPDDCWEWTASRFPEGYGRIGVRSSPGGVERAHRVALAWALGRPIAAGMEACHTRYGTQVALARVMGVTRETIREIRLGKRWPHLMGGQ